MEEGGQLGTGCIRFCIFMALPSRKRDDKGKKESQRERFDHEVYSEGGELSRDGGVRGRHGRQGNLAEGMRREGGEKSIKWYGEECDKFV